MFEQSLHALLLRLLKDLCHNTPDQHLRVGIWSGKVELENLRLRSDALRKFGLPLNVKYGIIKKVVLIVPWKKPADPSSLLVSGVSVVLEPKDLSAPWTDEDNRDLQNEKMAEVWLRAKLRRLRARERGLGKGKSGSNRGASSFLEKLIDIVLRKVVLRIQDVCITYEESISSGHVSGCWRHILVGATLGDLSLQTLEGKADSTLRKMTLTNFTVRAAMDGEELGAADDPSHVEEWLSQRIGSMAPSGDVILDRFCAEVMVTIKREAVGKSKKATRMMADVRVPPFEVVVTEEHLIIANTLRQYKSMYAVLAKYRRIRPVLSVKEAPREWWMYAARLILANRLYSRARCNLDYIMERRELRLRYMRAYTVAQNLSWVKSDKADRAAAAAELGKLHEFLGLEDIVFFQALAERDMYRDYAVHARGKSTSSNKGVEIIKKIFLKQGSKSTPPRSPASPRSPRTPLEVVDEGWGEQGRVVSGSDASARDSDASYDSDVESSMEISEFLDSEGFRTAESLLTKEERGKLVEWFDVSQSNDGDNLRANDYPEGFIRFSLRVDAPQVTVALAGASKRCPLMQVEVYGAKLAYESEPNGNRKSLWMSVQDMAVVDFYSSPTHPEVFAFACTRVRWGDAPAGSEEGKEGESVDVRHRPASMPPLAVLTYYTNPHGREEQKALSLATCALEVQVRPNLVRRLAAVMRRVGAVGFESNILSGDASGAVNEAGIGLKETKRGNVLESIAVSISIEAPVLVIRSEGGDNPAEMVCDLGSISVNTCNPKITTRGSDADSLSPASLTVSVKRAQAYIQKIPKKPQGQAWSRYVVMAPASIDIAVELPSWDRPRRRASSVSSQSSNNQTAAASIRVQCSPFFLSLNQFSMMDALAITHDATSFSPLRPSGRVDYIETMVCRIGNDALWVERWVAVNIFKGLLMILDGCEDSVSKHVIDIRNVEVTEAPGKETPVFTLTDSSSAATVLMLSAENKASSAKWRSLLHSCKTRQKYMTWAEDGLSTTALRVALNQTRRVGKEIGNSLQKPGRSFEIEGSLPTITIQLDSIHNGVLLPLMSKQIVETSLILISTPECVDVSLKARNIYVRSHNAGHSETPQIRQLLRNTNPLNSDAAMPFLSFGLTRRFHGAVEGHLPLEISARLAKLEVVYDLSVLSGISSFVMDRFSETTEFLRERKKTKSECEEAMMPHRPVKPMWDKVRANVRSASRKNGGAANHPRDRENARVLLRLEGIQIALFVENDFSEFANAQVGPIDARLEMWTTKEVASVSVDSFVVTDPNCTFHPHERVVTIGRAVTIVRRGSDPASPTVEPDIKVQRGCIDVFFTRFKRCHTSYAGAGRRGELSVRCGPSRLVVLGPFIKETVSFMSQSPMFIRILRKALKRCPARPPVDPKPKVSGGASNGAARGVLALHISVDCPLIVVPQSTGCATCFVLEMGSVRVHTPLVGPEANLAYHADIEGIRLLAVRGEESYGSLAGSKGGAAMYRSVLRIESDRKLLGAVDHDDLDRGDLFFHEVVPPVSFKAVLDLPMKTGLRQETAAPRCRAAFSPVSLCIGQKDIEQALRCALSFVELKDVIDALHNGKRVMDYLDSRGLFRKAVAEPSIRNHDRITDTGRSSKPFDCKFDVPVAKVDIVFSSRDSLAKGPEGEVSLQACIHNLGIAVQRGVERDRTTEIKLGSMEILCAPAGGEYVAILTTSRQVTELTSHIPPEAPHHNLNRYSSTAWSIAAKAKSSFASDGPNPSTGTPLTRRPSQGISSPQQGPRHSSSPSLGPRSPSLAAVLPKAHVLLYIVESYVEPIEVTAVLDSPQIWLNPQIISEVVFVVTDLIMVFERNSIGSSRHPKDIPFDKCSMGYHDMHLSTPHALDGRGNKPPGERDLAFRKASLESEEEEERNSYNEEARTPDVERRQSWMQSAEKSPPLLLNALPKWIHSSVTDALNLSPKYDTGQPSRGKGYRVNITIQSIVVAIGPEPARSSVAPYIAVSGSVLTKIHHTSHKPGHPVVSIILQDIGVCGWVLPAGSQPGNRAVLGQSPIIHPFTMDVTVEEEQAVSNRSASSNLNRRTSNVRLYSGDVWCEVSCTDVVVMLTIMDQVFCKTNVENVLDIIQVSKNIYEYTVTSLRKGKVLPPLDPEGELDAGLDSACEHDGTARPQGHEGAGAGEINQEELRIVLNHDFDIDLSAGLVHIDLVDDVIDYRQPVIGISIEATSAELRHVRDPDGGRLSITELIKVKCTPTYVRATKGHIVPLSPPFLLGLQASEGIVSGSLNVTCTLQCPEPVSLTIPPDLLRTLYAVGAQCKRRMDDFREIVQSDEASDIDCPPTSQPYIISNLSGHLVHYWANGDVDANGQNLGYSVDDSDKAVVKCPASSLHPALRSTGSARASDSSTSKMGMAGSGPQVQVLVQHEGSQTVQVSMARRACVAVPLDIKSDASAISTHAATVLYDVTAKEGGKILAIRSAAAVVNHCSIPLSVVCGASCDVVLQPAQEYSLPVGCHGDLRIRPVVEMMTFSYTCPLPIDDILRAHEKSKEASSCYFTSDAAGNAPDYTFAVKVRKTNGEMFIDFHPPVTLENLLPAPLSFECGGMGITGSIIPDGLAHLYDTPADVKLKFDLKSDDAEFRSAGPLSIDTCRTTDILMSCGERKISIMIEVAPSGSGVHCTLYATHWILNKAEIPISLEFGKELHQLMPGDGGMPTFVHSLSTSEIPIVAANATGGRTPLVKLTVYGATSGAFHLPADDTIKTICCSTTEADWGEAHRYDAIPRVFEFGIVVMPCTGRHWRTKTVTISPRFVISNCTEHAMQVMQCSKELEQGLYGNMAMGTRANPVTVAFHWKDSTLKRRRMAVRLGEGTRSWSTPIDIENIGMHIVRLTAPIAGKVLLISVTVELTDGCIRITLASHNMGWPYHIRNLTCLDLMYHQTKSSKVYHIKPGDTHGYTWDFLRSKDRLLVVRNKSGTFQGLLPIDHVGVLSTPVWVPVGSDGAAFIKLMIWVRLDGYTREITIQEEGRYNGGGGPVPVVSTDELGDIDEEMEASASESDDNIDSGDDVPRIHIPEDTAVPSDQAEKDEWLLVDDLRPQGYHYSFTLKLNSISVSILEPSPEQDDKNRELLHLTMSDCEAKVDLHQGEIHLHLGAHRLQLDNQLHHAVHPVIFSVERNSQGRLFQLEIKYSLKHSSRRLNFFRYISFLLSPCNLALDATLVIHLLQLLRTIRAEPAESLVTRADLEKSVAMQNLRKGIHGARHERIRRFLYVEVMLVHPIQLNFACSTKMIGGDRFDRAVMRETRGVAGILMFAPVRAVILSLGSVLGNLDWTSITLNALLVENAHNANVDITSAVVAHYTQNLKEEMYKLVGASELLGNPVGLIKNIGTGCADFVYEPAHGIVTGPADFAAGLKRGTVSLVRNSMFGVMNSASKISGSVSLGLSRLSMDDEFVNQNVRNDAKVARHVGEGVVQGGASLGRGVVAGFSGLVRQPIEGARRKGTIGAFSGAGKGIVGLLVKPSAGLIEAASKTSEGIGNTVAFLTETQNTITRVKPPSGS